jgi:hypothetical protein
MSMLNVHEQILIGGHILQQNLRILLLSHRFVNHKLEFNKSFRLEAWRAGDSDEQSGL